MRLRVPWIVPTSTSFRVTALSINGGNTINFQYDNNSLLTQAGDLALSRDSLNGLITASTLNNVTDSLSYNGFGELTDYSASASGTPVYSLQLRRDKPERITEKTETIGGATDVFSYTYDLTWRLTEVKKNGASTATYTYDSNGNRLTGSSGTTYSYDDQDRLLTVTGTNTSTFAYTANGNLLNKTVNGQTTSYNYDVLGNLRSVTLPNSTQIEYVIDGQNRRVSKRVNGTLVQGFLYRDQLRPITELDGNNNVVSVFVYGKSTTASDYMIKSGVQYRIVSDHLGSPRLVINSQSGQIVQRLDYDEFGNILQDTNPGFQPFGFAGSLYDPLTGLTRFGMRDYDAEIGRWTAKDPIGFFGGDANLYRYVLNDPVNFRDPFGLDSRVHGCSTESGFDIGKFLETIGRSIFFSRSLGNPVGAGPAEKAAELAPEFHKGTVGTIKNFFINRGATVHIYCASNDTRCFALAAVLDDLGRDPDGSGEQIYEAEHLYVRTLVSSGAAGERLSKDDIPSLYPILP